MNNAFKPADILVPKKSVDMNKWSVIACDQYTSEPEYWKQTSKIVGQNYSSLNLIESFLILFSLSSVLRTFNAISFLSSKLAFLNASLTIFSYISL